MAGNIDVTPGTGKTVSTDDVGGAQYQKVKLDGGAAGASDPILGTNTYGLYVDVKRLPALDAASDDVTMYAQYDDVATTLPSENGLAALRITANRGLHANLRAADGTELGVAAAPVQVSLANTAANGTAVAVSVATIPSHAVTNAGTFAVQAASTIADGANVTLGAKADAKSTATDSTAVSAMSVLKQISASVQAPPSQDVTNAGTFATQAAATVADGADVTLGAKADGKSTATDTTAVSIMSVLKQVSASVQAPPSQAVTNAGTFAVQAVAAGVAAHDAAVSGNPVLIGAEARTNQGTPVTEGDVVRPIANRYGKLIVGALVPSRASSNGTPITATTTGVITAPSAGNHIRVTRIHLANGGSTACWASIRDGASGTKFYPVYLVQGAIFSVNLETSGPLDLTTATRLDIVLSAAGSVEYTIDYKTLAD